MYVLDELLWVCSRSQSCWTIEMTFCEDITILFHHVLNMRPLSRDAAYWTNTWMEKLLLYQEDLWFQSTIWKLSTKNSTKSRFEKINHMVWLNGHAFQEDHTLHTITPTSQLETIEFHNHWNNFNKYTIILLDWQIITKRQLLSPRLDVETSTAGFQN